jgi:hypothetical protein
MHIGQLMPEKYPMLCAFDELNKSLSNSAQSAPGSNADFTELEWYNIEMALRELPAHEFVVIAYAHYFTDTREMEQHHHEIWQLPAFREWAKTWE